MNYKPVVGLEVHIELKTKSKMFCGCSADYFGHKPNTHVCPVCLGLPGALPVPNKQAINWCIMIGLALNCQIPLFSKFDRKNYFYPDLPKGYQISQYDKPFCVNGSIEIARHLPGAQPKRIRIRRVHMEEDTAKLTHGVIDGEKVSLIDFNRCGVPLVEIVTEPDFENALEVKECLQKIQQLVRYLDVSNADMEKGDMRLEPNISIHSYTSEVLQSEVNYLPNYKVEVKNINSFRFVEKAINYEIERQRKILEAGKIPEQETRGWDEKKQITVSQRTKEEAHDYRYFPEPDIPPIRWEKSQISNIKLQMPELPEEKFDRFKKNYELTDYDAEILTREKDTADYFEETVKVGKKHNVTPKQITNMIINKKIDINTVLPAQLVKTILSLTQIASIDQEELEKIVKQVLAENSKAVEDYRKGKNEVLGFLIGAVNRKLKSQKIDTQIIKRALNNYLK